MTIKNRKFNAWQGRRYRPSRLVRGVLTYKPISDKQKAINAQGLALCQTALATKKTSIKQEVATQL